MLTGEVIPGNTPLTSTGEVSVSLNSDGDILAIGEASSHSGGITTPRDGRVRVFEYFDDAWNIKGDEILYSSERLLESFSLASFSEVIAWQIIGNLGENYSISPIQRLFINFKDPVVGASGGDSPDI